MENDRFILNRNSDVKVIIDNSRGLRLGFFIELAEYFIFFIFKLLCVHKDEKQNFLYMYRNEKQ